MPNDFDPYSEWLGIPPEEQPPDHYRLLGIEQFESDTELIKKAAEAKIEFLRTFQLGKRFSFSQKLMAEVASARVCLLNSEKKAAYDAQLRGHSESAQEKAPVGPPSPQMIEEPFVEEPAKIFGEIATDNRTSRMRRQLRDKSATNKTSQRTLTVAGLITAAGVLLCMLLLFRGGKDAERNQQMIAQQNEAAREAQERAGRQIEEAQEQTARIARVEAKGKAREEASPAGTSKGKKRKARIPREAVEWNALEPKFNTHTISKDASTAHGVFAADVDSDGDIDVLSAAYWGGKLAWHENDGSQNFVPHVISTDPKKSLCVYASDIDGDGDTDVLTASDVRYNGNGIAWYENDGRENFTPHIVSKSSDFRCVFARDVDSDGDTDILSASPNDNTIILYENNGMQAFTSHTISNNAVGAHSVFAEDLDGDGDTDILSASAGNHEITWYENRGNHNFISRIISTNAAGANCVFVHDVDGDGDLDVLSSSFGDNKIAWYENDGKQHFLAHTISTDHINARSVFACDIDKDGDTDVISASSDDAKVAWHENDGQENFRTHIISKETDAVSMHVADVDNDGDPDVLTASYGSGKIKWHENQQATTSSKGVARDESTEPRNPRKPTLLKKSIPSGRSARNILDDANLWEGKSGVWYLKRADNFAARSYEQLSRSSRIRTALRAVNGRLPTPDEMKSPPVRR